MFKEISVDACAAARIVPDLPRAGEINTHTGIGAALACGLQCAWDGAGVSAAAFFYSLAPNIFFRAHSVTFFTRSRE
jgi:hypothetical protein